MIRKPFAHLLLGLLCLSLIACGTLEVGRQQESAVGQVEVAENAAVVTAESDAPTSGSVTLKAPPPTTEITETEAIVDVFSAPEDPVYSQKMGETLVLPTCYDFDGGASVVPADPACDFVLLPGQHDGAIEVYPQAGAQLAYGGVFPETPTLAQCAASDASSGEREIVAPLAMYVCFRTGEGRTGYLHFITADVEQAGTLALDWVTFAGESGAGGDGEWEELAYRDDTFGFELTLPSTWAGFDTTQHDHENGSSICFTFTGSVPFCVLKIDVWRKAAWNELERIPEGYYLGENEQYVFASGPYQPECVQLDDFQCARHLEIPAVRAGFVAESVGPAPDILYRNETYGFRLTLPGTWAGFQTMKYEQGDVTHICFTFSEYAPVCVFQVDVYSRAAWERTDAIPPNYYRGENERYVFGSGSDIGPCPQIDDFPCARHLEIPGILAEFAAE